MAGSIQDSPYAWVVCVACFMIQLVLGGFLYAPGMFFIMFKYGLDASDSALSFITSLNICLIYLVCPVVGLLTDRYGERLISSIGVILSTVALACCSFSTQVYHLYILYGVSAGIGQGMMYNSSLSIIPQYFNKYMRVATCITLCGPGVGSFIFPPLLNALENQFGWRGAMLLIAGLNAQTLICCCLFRPAPAKSQSIKIAGKRGDGLTKSRNHWGNEKVRWEREVCDVDVKSRDLETDSMLLRTGKLHSQNDTIDTTRGLKNVSTENQQSDCEDHLNVKENKTCDKPSTKENSKIPLLFKNVTFLCLLSLHLLINFPIGIVGTHFGNYVLTLGYTKSDVVLLYMMWGISSTVTRLIVGVCAQVTNSNPAPLIMAACIVNGVLTVILPHTSQLWFLYAFAILHQLLLSFYNILNVHLLVESLRGGNAAVALGLSWGSCTPGVAIGPPLAAWLYGSTLVYSSSFYLSGILLVLAGLTMVLPSFKSKIGKNDMLAPKSSLQS